MNKNKLKKPMKTSKERTREITLAAILCAAGIIVVMFSPFKLLLEPASFTLASHVAIFIAMFVSPTVAITVSIITTLAFFLAGFPIVVVARAASQIFFVLAGALVLQKHPGVLKKTPQLVWFGIWTGIVHAVAEMLVVLPFYFSNSMSSGYYEKGYFISIFLLVGVGTMIHSVVDFVLALFVWKAINRNKL